MMPRVMRFRPLSFHGNLAKYCQLDRTVESLDRLMLDGEI